MLPRKTTLKNPWGLFCAILVAVYIPCMSLTPRIMPRRNLIRHVGSCWFVGMSFFSNGANAFAVNSPPPVPERGTIADQTKDVAYRSLTLDMQDAKVPVAMWYPASRTTKSLSTSPRYAHRISVRRIGQLLAQWDFIPAFASKDFKLKPTTSNVFQESGTPEFPKGLPVVLLAHGYLGSRFDLAHIAEALALEGFVCLSCEYPESLAASYERIEGLDRTKINTQLMEDIVQQLDPTSLGIVGHSLGTGTALQTGDDSWARICIAGFPRNMRDGTPVTNSKVLFISSLNDGVVSPARFGGANAVPSDIALLNQEERSWVDSKPIPHRAMLLLDGKDAPNHISFLQEGVNDAMMDFLAPLLPIAQSMNIPVLDFDRYQKSRDSRQAAETVIPLVTAYLKQEMIKSR